MSTWNFPTRLPPSAPCQAYILPRNWKPNSSWKQGSALLGFGPIVPIAPSVLRTKDFFSLWGQYFPLSASGSMSCFLPLHQRQQKTIKQYYAEAPVLQGSCFPSKVPISLLNFPHLSWTAISWSYGHQTSSQSGLMWQTGRNKPKLSSLPGNQLQG